MREALVAAGAIALFATLEALFHVFAYFSDKRSRELRRRLQAIGSASALDAELLRRGRLARSPARAAIIGAVPGAHRLERLLEQADSRWTVAELLTYAVAAGAAGATLGLALGRGAVPVATLALLGVAAPVLTVLSARSRRSRKLSEQLPEALDMMARSLRAGHALTSSFQVVAGEMPEPVSIEFARAYEEQRLGVSLERAVTQMSARAPGNSDLKIFAVSAVIQRETGGNLAEILEKIADTIRQRYRFYGKLRSLTAEGRASALVLGILPFGMAIALSVMKPGYLASLAGSPMGRAMLLYALVSWGFGLMWLNRMTKLEV